jgi:hypothetical protein
LEEYETDCGSAVGVQHIKRRRKKLAIIPLLLKEWNKLFCMANGDFVQSSHFFDCRVSPLRCWLFVVGCLLVVVC